MEISLKCRVLLVLFLLGLMIALSVFPSMVSAQKGGYDRPNWATSIAGSGNNMQLGLFDKNRVLSNFTVVFIVKGPDGKQFRAQKKQNLKVDEWVFAIFPHEFNVSQAGLRAGTYSWKAAVGREMISGGEKFNYIRGVGFSVLLLSAINSSHSAEINVN
ncbi:MAG: hypothetical protein FJ135_03200 [Deltaproteobacteria bacterium]|nr:hypothetical protein [Deltaproteobacteria bacterium]